MPPEVHSYRIEILPREEYARLAKAWKGYADGHPESAVAWVQLARAMRYAGEGTEEERAALIDKALDLDGDCPEALSAMARREISSGRSRDAARRHALRAVEAAPDWPEPHFNLCTIAIIRGDAEAMRRQSEALLQDGALPAPLLDFGYNLLESAGNGATLFTNGDNDTFPLLALQSARGVRTDVRIVNLSLLNIAEYARNVWRGAPDPPVSPEEAARSSQQWRQPQRQPGQSNRSETFSEHLLEGIVQRIRSGDWNRPVYLPVTVSQRYLQHCEDHMLIEGLLWRVTSERRAPGQAEGARPVDAARTLHLFRDIFRLDSATDFAFPWGPHSAVGKLVANYPAVLWPAARSLAEAGDLEGTRDAMRTAIRLLEFHDDTRKAELFAQYYAELDPEGARQR